MSALRSVPKPEPDLNAAMHDARIIVANARIWAFEDECIRLGQMLKHAPARRQEVFDFLQELAVSHGLVRTLGETLIHSMMVAGAEGGDA
ncbi:MAG: hypothetical protein JWQ51_175 [Tardiphaga sp.]|nr:hypothetical protein [Tardiphaga sp.]